MPAQPTLLRQSPTVIYLHLRESTARKDVLTYIHIDSVLKILGLTLYIQSSCYRLVTITNKDEQENRRRALQQTTNKVQRIYTANLTTDRVDPRKVKTA